MRKKPENLADPRMLLTEVGEQQWLNNMLDEATSHQQAEKKYAAQAAATKRPKNSRKAA